MKKKIGAHRDNIGPGVNLDLDDVVLIQEFGDRNGAAGWVTAEITLRSNKVLNIKLTPENFDDLVTDWEDKPVV